MFTNKKQHFEIGFFIVKNCTYVYWSDNRTFPCDNIAHFFFATFNSPK